ncbi:hypothetical protein RFI_32364 [Reticulomyxa filosa]|uniref:Uncharacterized protein n=1 Tax=Reticulomyxa filosa TaxID=46433 RepID=X6LUH8_RETFI|nr:hypothetical protein RFI_32364 [Reticulomyxa filosa]|eukprot:ETO05031.1 hypothetical protein RFI_32364 [Reticulomyxa filosa]
MSNSNSKKETLLISKDEAIQIIIGHWIQTLNIKVGWIHDFNKLVVKYVRLLFLFNSNSNVQLLICIVSFSYFIGHSSPVANIDYSTFDSSLLCSSTNTSVYVWRIESTSPITTFNGYQCAKFSPYYHLNHRRNVICFSSYENSICFWDIKDEKKFQTFSGHTMSVRCIEFSPFSGGRYLCSGSNDNTIRLWDIETSESLHVFKGHIDYVWCMDISPPRNDTENMIEEIGGNGYTICSGSHDKTIRIWDIEQGKQIVVLNGHTFSVNSVKYGSYALENMILSGSSDNSVRLWDIRDGQQVQRFNEHKHVVTAVEYAPFVTKNSSGNANVICSGSLDNTIRFWDIRSNKKELYMIERKREDYGIYCLKFAPLKKNGSCNEDCDFKLCYGTLSGQIYIWG